MNKVFWGLRSEERYTLGQICEMFPYAVIGYFIPLRKNEKIEDGVVYFT